MNALLLGMFADKEIDVSEYIDAVTNAELAGIALLLGFFVVRPELWRRIWLQRVDPRPAALMRIAFGLVVLVTFLVLFLPQGPLPYSVARYLFTDDGMWLNDNARKLYGAGLKNKWDPVHGFEHWYDVFVLLWGKFTPLHLRSDPPFVFALYTLMLLSLTLMILGVRTRITTITSFLLVETFYRYSPIFFTGGDTVIRVFMFLSIFVRWGEAYSIDAWRRRRREILQGTTRLLPPLRKIPSWPMVIMMVQLCCIYCATGLLKKGGTWRDGSALYYALNLDHFYRYPMTQVVTLGHFFGITRLSTVLAHWWEMLFPIALLGVAINAYEREREAGAWPYPRVWRRVLSYLVFTAAWAMGAYVAGVGGYYFLPSRVLAGNRALLIPIVAGLVVGGPLLLVGLYLVLRRFAPRIFQFIRIWVLGKRFWLTFGFAMHLGILAGINVGTFAPVMPAVYFVWLSGAEVEGFWRYLYSRAQPPGEGGRPKRRTRFAVLLLGPIDACLHRRPGLKLVVHHHPDEASVRRAALLRLWDLGNTLSFVENDEVAPQTLHVRREGAGHMVSGNAAAAALTVVLPGLFWLRPFRRFDVTGLLARVILRQRI